MLAHNDSFIGEAGLALKSAPMAAPTGGEYSSGRGGGPPPPPPAPPEESAGRPRFSFLQFFCSPATRESEAPPPPPPPVAPEVERLREEVSNLRRELRDIAERLAPRARPITPDEPARAAFAEPAAEAAPAGKDPSPPPPPAASPPPAMSPPPPPRVSAGRRRAAASPPRAGEFRAIGGARPRLASDPRPRSLSDPRPRSLSDRDPTVSPAQRRGRCASTISALTESDDSPPTKRLSSPGRHAARDEASPSSRFGSIPGSVDSATTLRTAASLASRSPAPPRARRSDSASTTHLSSLASSFKTAMTHFSCAGEEPSPFRSPTRTFVAAHRRPRSLSNLTSIPDSTPSPLTPHRCSSEDLTVDTAQSSLGDQLAKLPYIAPTGEARGDADETALARKHLEVARAAYAEAKRKLACAKLAVSLEGSSLLREEPAGDDAAARRRASSSS